ncbi:MAG: hypothetical protein AAFN92_05400, partial [Bacteroidota bacterium]
MKPYHLVTLALPLFFFACTPEDAPLPPPNEWVVVGNDLGLRNEFVDMANIVVTKDSSITVYSAANPGWETSFPLVDSVVRGGPDPDLHWRLQTNGPDSLVLVDSVKDNRYHLRRLRRTELPDSLANFLRAGELVRERDYHSTYFLFAGVADGTSCYGMRRYYQQTDWSKAVAAARNGQPIADPEPELVGPPIRRETIDGFWRVEDRFAQPMFLYTEGSDKHYLVLVDSLQPGAAVYGDLVQNYVPNRIAQGVTYRLDTGKVVRRDLPELLSSLDPERGIATSTFDSVGTSYWRYSFSGRELREGIVVPDIDLPALRLEFPGPGTYRIYNEVRTVATGKWSGRDGASYLFANGGCANDEHWPYVATDTSISIGVPLKIEITGLPPDENAPLRRKYFLDE